MLTATAKILRIAPEAEDYERSERGTSGAVVARGRF